MRRKSGVISIILILFILCGCGDNDNKQIAGIASDNFVDISENWKDNSIDLYSATSRPVQLFITEPDDAVAGGAYGWMLSRDSVAGFKKHLYSDAENCWDEVVYIDESRVAVNKKITEGIERQAWSIGGCAGSENYIIMLTDGSVDIGETNYFIAEYNEKFDETGCIALNFLPDDNSWYPTCIYMDVADNIHMLMVNAFNDGTIYYIASKDGSKIYEKELKSNDNAKLLVDYEGSVLLRVNDSSIEINPADGTENIFYELSGYDCGIHYDDQKIVYANTEGVFIKDISSENNEEIYHWGNHGETVFGIDAISVGTNGDINVLYENMCGKTIISIAPTESNVDIKTISFAVSANSKNVYQSAVAEFNRNYPAYRIEFVEYTYGDTKFLSELIAGQGAVLIDSSIGDFEQQCKYWEPLDNIFSQIIVDNEVITKAVDLGRLDGILYGIVTDFSINTLVVGREDIDDWSYGSFIEYINEQDNLVGIFNGASLDSGLAFVQKFFIHGMEDNYLFNNSEGTTYFETVDFRNIIHLGKEYQDRNCDFSQLIDGTLLCMEARIDRPQQVAFLRVLMEDKARYIGYPSENESIYYITTDAPITVRASASDDEKRVAYTFLQMLLSRDIQESLAQNTQFNMSVRWDVLDKQIRDINTKDDYCIIGFPQICLEEDQINYETDSETIYELISNAKAERMLPKELRMIIIEELDAYFSGNATEDMVINSLENRVGLYLIEHQ